MQIDAPLHIASMSENQTEHIQVFHDGECPVCRVEISIYDRMDSANRILWTDITSLPDVALPKGKSRADLLGRFHVRNLAPSKPTGGREWFIGVDAFAAIWRELPVLKWFAWIFSVPGIRQLAQLAYLGFLRWQVGHRKRRKAGA